MGKFQDKEKILKAAREKHELTYKRAPVRLATDFSMETLQARRRAIKRDPEGNFIILKGRIHQEDINIVNIYAPNIGVPNYIKKIVEDFKKDIDSNISIVGDFNIPL